MPTYPRALEQLEDGSPEEVCRRLEKVRGTDPQRHTLKLSREDLEEMDPEEIENYLEVGRCLGE